MAVQEMTVADIPAIAALMNRIKPDWWSVEQATKQLTAGRGWFLTDERGEPVGWLSARK